MLSPKKAIDVINARYGVHPGHRALHAKGILGAGTFTATPEAAQLCTAAHLQGDPVRVTVRLSNAGGNPKVPDYAPDVRGIGIKFYLPDGSTTDIVAQTAPRFPVKTPGAFIEMVAASERTPAGLLRLPWFLARNLRVIPSLRENLASLQLPASYASVPYYAIHAFRWTSPTGDQAHVRYTVLPELDLGPLNPVEARKGGRDYLSDDLRRRLDEGPVRFRLQVQVAEPGDDVDDPRSVWPDDRRRVDIGTIELTGLDTERETGDDVLVFDPTRVTDGIDLSDDPILAYRSKAYSESIARRIG